MSVGLRERKKQKTRDALSEAAQSLFAKKGFEATTVDEIAEAAEVSRRTFFRYFPTKESVVFANYQNRLALFRSVLEAHAETMPPVAALRTAFLAMAEEYMRSRDEMSLQYRVVKESSTLAAYELDIDREWSEVIERALLRRGGSDADAVWRARILAGAAIGAARAMLTEWFEAGAEDDLKALAEEALDLLQQGFN